MTSQWDAGRSPNHGSGLLLGGVDANGVLYDEPAAHQPTITVRLDVDQALDATWRVVTATDPEGRLIGARDRSLVAVAQVGVNPDRQFSWARGSTLAKITDESVDDLLANNHDGHGRGCVPAIDDSASPAA